MLAHLGPFLISAGNAMQTHSTAHQRMAIARTCDPTPLESHMPTLVGPNVPHECLVGCSGAANDFNWRLVNGLWGFILAVGLLWTSLTVRQARSWLYFKGWARSFLADYGVPLLVVIWSAVGYCVNSGTPSGIPRRTRIPNTWDEKTNWTVARVCMQIMA